MLTFMSLSRVLINQIVYRQICCQRMLSPTWEQRIVKFLTLLAADFYSHPKRKWTKAEIKIISVCALQAVKNGFIWSFSAKTLHIVRRLPQLLKVKNKHAYSPALLFYSCFFPLSTLKNRLFFSEKNQPWYWRQLIQQTFLDQKREKKLRRQITRYLKESPSDLILKTVKKHYETYPYPVWDQLILRTYPVVIQPKRILIAGCGTGEYALQAAQCYPNAQIVAIDISLNSLAYAKRQQERYLFKNVRWQQADLLQLNVDKIGQFDLIESIGVLQHLSHPKMGLHQFVQLLVPGGYLRLGVSTVGARTPIQLAQARYPFKQQPTPLLFKKWRFHLVKAHQKIAWVQELMQWEDFYTYSTCYDLLCHVYEHAFSLQQIGQWIEAENLDFVKFEAFNTTQQVYLDFFSQQCHKNRRSDKEIWEQWAHFEQLNPNCFRPLSIFWCQKT